MRNGDFFWRNTDKGNAETFIEHLQQIKDCNKGKKLAIIVDNATSHKSKKVKAFLKNNTEIKLYFLPPYSPEYNPMEIIWRIIKAHTVGARQIKDGMKEVLRRISTLTKKWSDKITSHNVGPGIWSSIFK